MKMERINLTVTAGTRNKLINLAGGERRIGQYISELVDSLESPDERFDKAINQLRQRIFAIEQELADLRNIKF